MSENTFFKPTVLYKEYMILDMIEKNAHVTQREISQEIGIAVSMVNSYLDEYEKNKLIIRKKHSTKTVEYFVTKKGSERRKVLNIGYLYSSQHLYNSAKENIEKFLIEIETRGFKNILLYGAGEVCEILLSTIIGNPGLRLTCGAVIDDDPKKHGLLIYGVEIIEHTNITNYRHEGILISSFTNKEKIHAKLLRLGFDEDNIIHFFD